MSDRPNDLKYMPTHEWIRIDGDTATVGITDFAVEHLGDLVFVDLPSVGDDVSADQTVAEVESVKAVGAIECPASGEITETNDGLADDQGPLVADPYGEGWLFKMRVDSLSDKLIDLAAYESQLDAEG